MTTAQAHPLKTPSLWQVELEPVPLHLEPPTAQEFHTDLQQLFSAGEAQPNLKELNAAWTAMTDLQSPLSMSLPRQALRVLLPYPYVPPQASHIAPISISLTPGTAWPRPVREGP